MPANPAPAAAAGRRVKATLLRLLLGAAILMTPSAGHAQELGDRVRVTFQDGRIVGQVSQIGENGFEVDLEDGGSYAVVRADILLLERGVTRTWAKPMAIGGAVVLAGATGLLAAALSGLDYDGNATTAFARGALAGGAIGGGVGFLLGSAIRRTGWQGIPVGGVVITPAIGPGTLNGRAGLVFGGRLRF